MTTDGRLLRGEQTRRAILEHAMNIASAEGLDGLSIGRLSGELKISKSGLFTHFGSKEELQLATVRAGREVFVEAVITPARSTPPGLARVRSLMEHWLDYSRQRVFPGGCFLFQVSAEFDARPGRVRDEIAAAMIDWRSYLEASIARAVALGDLKPDTDAHFLAFKLDSYATTANGYALLHDELAAFDLAGHAIDQALTAAEA
jgi:AcrR family transcriptional regulator